MNSIRERYTAWLFLGITIVYLFAALFVADAPLRRSEMLFRCTVVFGLWTICRHNSNMAERGEAFQKMLRDRQKQLDPCKHCGARGQKLYVGSEWQCTNCGMNGDDAEKR